MSVPTWKRKLSDAEYVYQTYQLCIRLGEIMVNKPKKYKENYSDEIIKSALATLKHLQIADSIYLSKYTSVADFNIRREHMLVARGIIEHVATSSFIFLELVRKHDYASECENSRTYAKIHDQELEIGDMCEKCHNLITGIMKHDMDKFKEYIKTQ